MAANPCGGPTGALPTRPRSSDLAFPMTGHHATWQQVIEHMFVSSRAPGSGGQASTAFAMSARTSSVCSRPQLIRTVPGVIPAEASSSGVIPA